MKIEKKSLKRVIKFQSFFVCSFSSLLTAFNAFELSSPTNRNIVVLDEATIEGKFLWSRKGREKRRERSVRRSGKELKGKPRRSLGQGIFDKAFELWNFEKKIAKLSIFLAFLMEVNSFVKKKSKAEKIYKISLLTLKWNGIFPLLVI